MKHLVAYAALGFLVNGLDMSDGTELPAVSTTQVHDRTLKDKWSHTIKYKLDYDQERDSDTENFLHIQTTLF